jgi:hypothetical protein
MSEGTETSAAATPWARLARVTLFVVAVKVLVFGTVFLSLHLLPPIFDHDNYERRFHWPDDEQPNVTWLFKTWDSAHYLFLSERGYRAAGASAAFHPLWPSAIRAAIPVFGSSLVAALVLANLFSTAGLVVMHRLAERVADGATADTALLVNLAYPGAFFFCLPYTESLFLLITVSVFWLIASDRPGIAALLSVLAAPARAVGVFLAIPLGWRLFADWRRGRRPWWHCVAATAPLAGMALTLGMMWVETGNALAGIEAQAHFASRGAIDKFFAPAEFLQAFVDVWGVHGVLHSAIDRTFFVVMIIGIALVIRLEHRVGPWSLYSGALILVPAATMSFMSFTRYPTVVFPIFIALGAYLAVPARRELRWITISSFSVIQLFFLIRHINSYWAG